MIRGAIYVVGVAFSRFTLIALGALIANKLGENSYVQFVLFLTISNILTNFSLMGVLPRILSLPNNSDDDLLKLQYGGAANLLFAFFILIFLFLCGFCFTDSLNRQANSLFVVSVFFYCLGYFFLSLASALLNRVNQHEKAGYLWLLSSVLGLILAGISIFLQSYTFLLPIFSVTWFIVGVLGWLKTANGNIKIARGVFKNNLLFTMLKSIYSGLFGLPFLITFYVMGQYISSFPDVIGKSAFFLGFQLFTVAIFLPGVLGGIFVPKLSQVAHEQKRKLVKRLNLLYLTVGIMWVLVISCLLPWLFHIYGITSSNNSVTVVLLWQVSGVIAAIGAIQNQLLVSRGEYSFLLMGSILWTGIVIFIAAQFQEQMLGGVIGIFVAYLMLQVFYWHKNRNYFYNQGVSYGT